MDCKKKYNNVNVRFYEQNEKKGDFIVTYFPTRFINRLYLGKNCSSGRGIHNSCRNTFGNHPFLFCMLAMCLGLKDNNLIDFLRNLLNVHHYINKPQLIIKISDQRYYSLKL